MAKSKSRSGALTVAGSDSGGGAGIQADLKTFAAFGVHGTSAITCLTAQNPRRVTAVEPCSPGMLRRQLEAVYAELPPAAAKTGMLFSASNIRVVAKFLAGLQRRTPLVIDPVMVATSGRRLLAREAAAVLRDRLLPLATLITPNLDEAALLAESKISSLEAMRAAARKIQAHFGTAVLVKGGHLPDCAEATDVFFDGRREVLLTAPFVKGITTHGTGCTYSAAIAAGLALGNSLPVAVKNGKTFITRAITRSYRTAGHWVLDTLA